MNKQIDSKLEILILDDEEIVCARLKPALEKAGYIVETYTNSELAKTRLEQHRFDIVVTDLKMANIDGLEIFRFVKEKWPGTEVIIITGFATVDVTRAALRQGARDLIAKPFQIAQFKKIIDEVANHVRKRHS